MRHSNSELTGGLLALLALCGSAAALAAEPRARDLGVPFDGTPGPLNAITDVAGVEVGFKTLIRGSGPLIVGKGPVRTGVTAILPRGHRDTRSVLAGFFAGNGNGDMTGTHWIEESGVLETPILITNTNSVGVVRDAATAWLVGHGHPGFYFYPVAAETADHPLNDIRGQHVTTQDALDALDDARGGPVAEGNVGGGTGMVCNGFKGGTGTASRKLDAKYGGYTVGVLVQCNYGYSEGLRVAGIPVAREMRLQGECVTEQRTPPVLDWDGNPAEVCDPAMAAVADGIRKPEMGSIIVIVSTDAPLTPDQLKRLARRVAVGLGRLGAIEGDGSGDIFLAFSTANPGADEGNSEQPPFDDPNASVERLQSWKMNPLFSAVIEGTEEAVINSMVAARTMVGADNWKVSALPHDQLQAVLKAHGMLAK
jgi:L-aminopeptidase/D-esterase-like protein